MGTLPDNFYFETLRLEPVLPSDKQERLADRLCIEFNRISTAAAIEMAVGCPCDAIIARDAVSEIDFFSQTNTTNQFEVSPDSAITNRLVNLLNLLVQFIDRDVLSKLKKRLEDQFALRGHLKPLTTEKLSHSSLSSTLIETEFQLDQSGSRSQAKGMKKGSPTAGLPFDVSSCPAFI